MKLSDFQGPREPISDDDFNEIHGSIRFYLEESRNSGAIGKQEEFAIASWMTAFLLSEILWELRITRKLREGEVKFIPPDTKNPSNPH